MASIRNKNNEVIRIVGALKDVSESKYYHNVEILEREILELNALGNIAIEEIIGKSIEEIKKIDQKKLLELIDLNLSTSRIACATLTLKALQEAINQYEQENN